MKRRQNGFSLIELMVSLAIVMLVLVAAIDFFIISLRQYKVQTKIVETNLGGIVGLELLRKDVDSMGFGLPWNNLPAYTERTAAPAAVLALNESPNAPRAVAGINAPTFTVNNSDYLVIRSAMVGMNDAAGKWTTLTQSDVKRAWTPASENLQNTDRVIVMSLGSTDANRRSLVNPGTFHTTFGSTASYVPTEPYFANIIYGIDGALASLARPFNRADYYIDSSSVPTRCAPGTGVLVKAVVAQDVGGSTTLYPLMDCAADMQVAYYLDNNADGIPDAPIADIQAAFPPGATAAADLRAKLMEVRIYILAQEGQRDDEFDYPATQILVGPDNTVGRNFSVSGLRNYRWRVYTLVVKPMDLTQ